ncbi:hypothetical protein [Streptomyces sp. NPDC087300]|uniref:hypothetical protein n=1 Tax=Streptomyces sp. NPDC087300 TaxID=3365780 RepID=UPI0037FBCB22
MTKKAMPLVAILVGLAAAVLPPGSATTSLNKKDTEVVAAAHMSPVKADPRSPNVLLGSMVPSASC